jgi:hypothetical protein
MKPQNKTMPTTNSKEIADDIHNLEDSEWKEQPNSAQGKDNHKNGTLKILIVRGRLYRDTEFMGHMDPFI